MKANNNVIVEPVCFQCRWFIFYPYCLAFPAGIPQDVRLGLNNHEQPIVNDGGYKFEPIDEVNGGTSKPR
jgi:hypothetical protein